MPSRAHDNRRLDRPPTGCGRGSRGLRMLAAWLLTVGLVGCDDPPTAPAAQQAAAAKSAQPAGAGGAAATQPAGAAGASSTTTTAAALPVVYEPKREEPLRQGQVRKGATTLLLTSEDFQESEPRTGGISQSLLARELARQAVLIAGRDGLGLSTRDAGLREPLAAADAAGKGDASDLPLDLHWFVSPQPEVYFALADHDPKFDKPGQEVGRGTVFGVPLTVKPWIEHRITLPKADDPRYVNVVDVLERAERLSRAELVEALERAGFAGKANAADPDGAVAPGIVEALDKLDLFSQFQAVRAAHAEIRVKGESPARLAVLVRGYANLGQLAQFHWTAAHNVLAARSLLYAQRMVATAPEAGGSSALWHRAYASALAGLHADALRDLDEAAKRVEALGAAEKPKPPSFVELLGPYCRYQSGKLANLALADRTRAPLAMFLCYLTMETADSVSMLLELGKAALEVDAATARVMDSMSERAGISYLHGLTQAAPDTFAALMLARLKPMRDLPESVRAVGKKNWQAPATRAAVARAMVEAGAPGKDTAEPSWAVLGRQVQETHFVQTYRRTYFMARQWAVDARPFARQAAPLIEGHPYALWIKAVAEGEQNIDRKDLANVHFVDAEARGGDLMWAVIQARYREWPKYSGDISVHANRTAAHLERELARPKAEAIAATLVDVSPHSPAAIAYLITHAWDANVDKVKAWEANSDGHPKVMAAFARRHTEAGQPAEAERFLKRFIERSPDYWAYEMLAENYLAMGKEDRFVATLEEILEKEDYGLTHGQARVRIARHFMFKGDYRRAEPYALAAAQTGAEWTMTTAADLYEGMGQMDKSEQWMREALERYGDELTWHRWCLRTGRGDLKAAERDARRVAEASAGARDPGTRGTAGVFYLVLGDPEAARPHLEKATEYPVHALHLALIHEAEHDSGQRDRAMMFIRMNAQGGMMPYPDLKDLVEVAVLMDKTWQAGPLEPLDLKEVERLAAGASPRARTTIDYFVGRCLDVQGSTDQATKYYTRCIKGERSLATATLAWLELKKRGIDPATLIAPAAAGAAGAAGANAPPAEGAGGGK